MRIEKVIINNFRNINHAEYSLKDLNIFTGPNAKGKTNTILAIYWALADYLMDGSSDYQSFKPHSDSAAEVSVELIFDSFKFKKTYQEHWTKTRGSNEVTLTGHDTTYFIDDVKYSVSEGKKILIEQLGISEIKSTSKIDLLRAIVDPYYLAQVVHWKDLRTFIIDLVGDVDNEDLLNSNKQYEIIEGDLSKYKFDVTALTKLYKQQIKQSSDEIEKQENIITGYKAISDVDQSELAKAEVNITLIDNDIAALRVQQKTSINPKVAELEKEHANLQVAYVESSKADRQKLQQINAEVNMQIQVLSDELYSKKKMLDEIQKKAQEEKRNTEEQEYQLTKKQREIEDKEAQKANLLKEWEQLDELIYQSSLTVQSCPNCNFVLNQDDLDMHKQAWENDKKKRMDSIVDKVKKLANEIDNLKFDINEIKKNRQDESVNHKDQIGLISEEINQIEISIHELQGQLKIEYMSDETARLITKGKEVKARLDQEKLQVNNNDIETLIIAKQNDKAPYIKVVSDHNAYLSIQNKIVEVKNIIANLQKSQVEYETKLMMLEEFIKDKLTMLKSNVAKVFRDLEFVLVESNIKEGSYNEVCYPLIIGSQTPFISGSGAEKIITGVYIIECVKDRLGLPNIPIIFDEADKLDTNTIATRLNTASQIISTKVDDINYEKVTLVSK